MQLDFLRRVWTELDQQHQELQEQSLVVLTTILTAVDSKLNGFLRNQTAGLEANAAQYAPKVKKRDKAAYALLKDYLDRTIFDMESWQKRFDPSWYLIMRVASKHVDNELYSTIQENRNIMTASGIRNSLAETPQLEVHVFLPEAELESAIIDELPFSTVKVMHRKSSTKSLVLDTVPCNSTGVFSERRKAVRDLARKLMIADPSNLALLKCAGVIANKAYNHFTLVFKIPNDMSDPQSLRSRLISGEAGHSLSDRFQSATQLATAVCSIHTFGFVHKSIRPENVIIFRDQNSSIGSGFLLGFEDVRLEEGRTRLIQEVDWEKNIYRHPQRQGRRLKDPYIMQHDVYSLGVCLLEIGLWTSFVQYRDNFSGPMESEKYRFGADSSTELEKAESVKNDLLTLALNSLSSHMGSKYAKVVQTCLTCLDEGCNDFGDETELQDEDGVLVAVRYIEKVSSSCKNLKIAAYIPRFFCS